MAELPALQGLGFAVPQTTGVFNPAFTAPRYTAQEFENALNFAPKPIAADTFSRPLGELGDTIATVVSPQFRLARALSSGALDAYSAPVLAPVTQTAPVATGAVIAPIAQSTTGPVLTATATGYHPVSPNDPAYKMEGGNLDAQGNPIHTLDAFRRGEVPNVTLAVDRQSSLFGKTGYSSDLNAPVLFSDTGSAFRGKGLSRVDVARDTAAGANSDENNRPIHFTVNNVSTSDGAPLFGYQANVDPSGKGRQPPTETTISPTESTGTQAATEVANQPMAAVGEAPAAPIVAPTIQPQRPASVASPVIVPPSSFQSRLTNAFGPGHPIIAPSGQVGYQTIAPISDLDRQAALADLNYKASQIKANEARARRQDQLASDDVGANGSTRSGVDPDERVKNALAAAGKRPSDFVKDGVFDRMGAQDALADARAKLPTVVADLSGLDDTQKFQASALTAELFGKRNGNQADKVNMVADLIRQGKDPVEIRAELSPSNLTARYSGQYKTDPAVVIYGTVATNFAGMKKIAELPEKERTGPDDLSFLFQYTNADNPRSAVTEAAFQEAGKTGSLPTRIQNVYNGVVSGNRLTQTQVEQFSRAIEHKLSGVREGYEVARERYKGLASATSANGEAVIGPDFNPAISKPGTSTPSTSATQKPATVNSQAEYDALPSGASYVDSAGNLHRKK